MAELEEAEHGDLSRARMWLMRAMGDEHGASISPSVPRTVKPLQPTSEPIAEPLPSRP